MWEHERGIEGGEFHVSAEELQRGEAFDETLLRGVVAVGQMSRATRNAYRVPYNTKQKAPRGTWGPGMRF